MTMEKLNASQPNQNTTTTPDNQEPATTIKSITRKPNPTPDN